MKFTLQCVTCPFSLHACPQMWLMGCGPIPVIERFLIMCHWYVILMLPLQTECACKWSTHGEAVYTGTSRNSCCVLLCICSLTQSVNEPAAFNTGWSFLSRWKTPVPFLLHPHCHASPGCSWCFPVPCLFEAGAGADAPHCATCHTQSRSRSLRKVVMGQGEITYWEQLDSVQR